MVFRNDILKIKNCVPLTADHIFLAKEKCCNPYWNQFEVKVPEVKGENQGLLYCVAEIEKKGESEISDCLITGKMIKGKKIINCRLYTKNIYTETYEPVKLEKGTYILRDIGYPFFEDKICFDVK